MDDRGSGSRTSPNGRHADVPLPRTERPDAPAYLRTYLERRERPGSGLPTAGADPFSMDGSANVPEDDSNLPLYLRQFRVRRAAGDPGISLAAPIADEETPTWTDAWAETSRSREVVLSPEDRPPRSGDRAVVDVHLVRHGETQGYSVNAGLTPMGRWQAHRRGHDLSKSIRDGEPLQIVCAATPRATETAEQIRRGAEQGLTLWARTAPIDGPVPMEEFRNFTVWTPSGEMDVTSAFREYHAVAERYERMAVGDRPLWLVELDRFVRVQRGGGDPIQFWMTTPLLSFEPPSVVVLRFWAGIQDLVSAAPDGGRILIATHSGPIRAFAAWALGHDAGEPYNLEDVRVKVRRSLTEAQVTYRNRSVEVHVPPAAEWPSWSGRRVGSVGLPTSSPAAGTTA
jgi:broad specificity phosphatase PhoE